ncbi:MAG: NAD(P)H-binding protein [Deinococcota bacterium]
MKRILLLGATGNLGRACLSELKARGYWVRATSRQGKNITLADETVKADLLEPASLHAACQDIDTIVSVAGAPVSLSLKWRAKTFAEVDYQGHMHLLDAAVSAGVDKFIYVSVFSTEATQHLAYIKAHHAVATALEAAKLEVSIIEPTGYFSAFAPFVTMAAWGAVPRFGDGSAQTNPIHDADLATLCVSAIEDTTARITVGGPEVLSRNDIIDLAFAVHTKTPRYLPVPNAVVALGSRLVRPIDARLAELMPFFGAVSQTNIIAPSYGTKRLEDYFQGLS